MKGLRLLGCLAGSAGKRAVHAALFPYTLVLIASVIVFPGSGMDASYITAHALHWPALHWGLLLSWLTLTLPATRRLLDDRQTFWLRTLPVGRIWFYGFVVGSALGVHVAWWALWTRGAGVLTGVLAASVAMGLQFQWLAGVRTRRDAGTALALFASWGWASDSAELMVGQLALGAGAAVLALQQAWLRAPEPPATGHHWVCSRSPDWALTSALVAAGLRGNPLAVVRVAALVGGAFWVTLMAQHNNPQWSEAQQMRLTLGLWGAVWGLSAAVLARPLLTAEHQLAWVLRSCGVSRRRRIACGLWPLLLVSAGVGGVYGAGLQATLAVGLSSVGWGLASASIVRWSTRGSGHDLGRQLLALGGAYGVFLLGVFWGWSSP